MVKEKRGEVGFCTKKGPLDFGHHEGLLPS